MLKCERITKIIFYDTIVEKCSNCQNIIIHINDYDDLILNIIKYHNVGHSRSYMNFLQINEADKKIINKFKNNFIIDDKISDDQNQICLICEKSLKKISINNEKFNFHICEYCGRMYIDKIQFKQYVEKCLNNLKKFYFLNKLKEIFTRKK